MNASQEVTTFHAGPAAGEVVERGELAGHLVGLVERGVDRAGQPEPVGDGGERGQDGEGVGPADDVEVVDLAVLLAQPQPLGEEEEVELGALGGLREVRERAELDVAAGRRVAPHGGVVDAGEVGGEVDLLAGLLIGRLRRSDARRSGWRDGQAEQPAQGVGLVGRAERTAALQLGHERRG